MRSFAYSAIRAGSSSSGGARMQRVAMSAGCGRSQLAGAEPTGPPRGYSQGAKMTLRGQVFKPRLPRALAPQRVQGPGLAEGALCPGRCSPPRNRRGAHTLYLGHVICPWRCGFEIGNLRAEGPADSRAAQHRRIPRQREKCATHTQPRRGWQEVAGPGRGSSPREHHVRVRRCCDG